ncbi:hypothetical protein [Acidiphilium acidophilum]|uniref:hypothetical protein n=1 Tax=Acidiphilium acidophilum TaxID=76588 RepID=UPI002E8E7A2B|nr:hypothetical protein [Acidiphilium acidophilum]
MLIEDKSSERFFFGKKKQKTFVTLVHSPFQQHSPNYKSFFASFFTKKEDPSFPPPPHQSPHDIRPAPCHNLDNPMNHDDKPQGT